MKYSQSYEVCGGSLMVSLSLECIVKNLLTPHEIACNYKNSPLNAKGATQFMVQ
jgi:hypothetical protein